MASGSHKVGSYQECSETPLIIACSAGHTDIVHMLVEKGAKVRHGMTKIIADKTGLYFQVNEVTTEGRSALLYAASKGREEIVTFLMSKVMLASDWSNEF